MHIIRFETCFFPITAVALFIVPNIEAQHLPDEPLTLKPKRTLKEEDFKACAKNYIA